MGPSPQNPTNASLWGNTTHMDYIAAQMRSLEDPSLAILSTGSHPGFLTYDGIDVNGKRIADEIMAETARLNAEKDRVVRFSIVGYSMGGLISRYAVGVLYANGYFDEIEAHQFTTFCTPHLGILRLESGLFASLFTWVAAKVLAHTGKQVFLKDATANSDRLPLLMWMVQPQLYFMRALSLFGRKLLYANVINDRRTSWYTASISKTDPYHSMVNADTSAYDLEYVDGYAPTVIDIRKPISFKRVEKPEKRPGNALLHALGVCRVAGTLVLFTPLWLVYFLGNTVVQHVRLSLRVKAFFRDGSNSLNHLYNTGTQAQNEPSQNALDGYLNYFLEHVEDLTDIFVDSVYSALDTDAYAEYEESVNRNPRNASQETTEHALINLEGKKVEGFRLGLTPMQEHIADQLNALRWEKYPVLIRNTKATHAAAIVRHKDPHFEEGRAVVAHFIDEFAGSIGGE